jgi:hypothetical protein
MKQRVYIRKDKIDKYLDSRPIRWIVNQMDDIGIKIEYRSLLQILNNRNECRLLYAIGMCKIFEVEFDDIFYIK